MINERVALFFTIDTRSELGASMRTVLAGVLALVGTCIVNACSDRATRVSCERAPQIDTTGNVIVCACECASNPAAECPRIPGDGRSKVPACWDDASSSEGSSSE